MVGVPATLDDLDALETRRDRASLRIDGLLILRRLGQHLAGIGAWNHRDERLASRSTMAEPARDTETVTPGGDWHPDPLVFSYLFTIRPGFVKGWGLHKHRRRLMNVPAGVWHADHKYRLPLNKDQIPYSFEGSRGW